MEMHVKLVTPYKQQMKSYQPTAGMAYTFSVKS